MSNTTFNTGTDINGILHLTPTEAFEALQHGAIIVDIREQHEVLSREMDIKDIVYMPGMEFYNNYKKLPKDKKIILCCAAGSRAKKATTFLLENGYQHVANLDGGILAWERHKFPMKNKPSWLADPFFARMISGRELPSDN